MSRFFDDKVGSPACTMAHHELLPTPDPVVTRAALIGLSGGWRAGEQRANPRLDHLPAPQPRQGGQALSGAGRREQASSQAAGAAELEECGGGKEIRGHRGRGRGQPPRLGLLDRRHPQWRRGAIRGEEDAPS